MYSLGLRCVGAALRAYAAVLRATCRVRVVGRHPAGPAVYAVWHGRLAFMPWLKNPARPSTILSSHSKDGRLGAAVGRAFGFQVAFGSSSKRGAGGARALLAALEAGQCIFLTPDGPRGPAGVCKPGATELAKLAGVPLIPCGAHTSRAKVFASWDKLALPLPFGTITCVVGAPLPSGTSATALAAALHAAQASAEAGGTVPDNARAHR